MDRFAGLSARRRLPTTNDIDPILNEFLRVPIRLDAQPESPTVPEVTPRRMRRFRANGTSRLTNDDMINSRRRAFDLRHEKEKTVAQQQSDREWDATLRYRDWRSKKAMKTIEPHRVQKDSHVLETVISERNEYFMDALKRASRDVPSGKMANTRAVTPEIRVAAKAAKRTFYWGS
jgi:hypothetical protein